ncbi:MAG: gamma-glutamyltransferase [Gemmatimonadales bacterium]
MTPSSAARSAILLSLIACAPASLPTNASSQSPPDVPAREHPEFTRGWKYPAGQQATVAAHAMVASSNRAAAEAGGEILKAGGNSVDAAVAVGFALTVTYPEAGNIGGGGYMIIRMADGRTAALDYREMAPAISSRNMYVDSAGRLTDGALAGRSASGVPGIVGGLIAAHSRYGSLPLAAVMAPAIRLADGMIVDSALARSVAGHAIIKQYAGASVFYPNGVPVAVGNRLSQPDLARTLRDIAAKGADGFYKGRTADLIVAEMQRGCPAGVKPRDRAWHRCGLITAQDLERYKPVWRTPVTTTFRGYRLLTMPPSSSGGITLGETLNILDGYPRLPGFGTVDYLHLLTSALQRSFTDRNALLGDPDFVKIPMRQLISRKYADRVRATIDPSHATPVSTMRMPSREGTETTQYSVVDSAGNAVSTTTTLNSLYGSGVFVEGAGFFLNNTMDDFASQPGTANQFGLIQGEANAIAPGKRMLSAMTPTIMLDPRGNLYMVLGGRGGPRIITSIAQVILNVIEHRMTLPDAVNAPRIHHQALPDTIRIDAGGFDPLTVARLTAMGYALTAQDYIGGSVVAIRRVPGGWEGMDDSRGYGGAAVGY